MSSNRALIVDDSRSARHVLGRMLENCGLEVHSVESAELALTFLQNSRPDVIFMDHLMPGMDGFAAVRVIKANPDTATIPVVMYTSQEGDMYLSQARALGAMGVLPKTLKHADVVEVLQQLNLQTNVVANVRSATPPRAPVNVPNSASNVSTIERDSVSAANTDVTPLVETDRDAVYSSSMPQLVHRIVTEVHAEMLRTQASQPDAERIWRTATAAAAVLVVALLGLVFYQQYQIQQFLQSSAAQSVTTLANASATNASSSRSNAALRAAAAPDVITPLPALTSMAPTAPTSPTPRTESEVVPYGEVPLAGARLERLRTLLDSLNTEKVKGLLRIEVFTGDFCLTGNPVAGYMPAADDVAVSRCDLIGNPFGDALTVQQRQSVSFANVVASVNSNPNSGVKVQLVDGAHKVQTVYPTPTAGVTAATWNRIAERNQRVEFTVLPAS